MYQIPQRRRITKDSKWVTISDLKIQAVKEICYEVALNDFRHTRQEIEALAIVKMKELCASYCKKDPNERDSWRAVARDVWDTVGVGDERIEDVITNCARPGGVVMDDLKVHINKLEDILQEVKKQNNMKGEEIRALRNKMVKMEKVLPLITPEGQEKPPVAGAPTSATRTPSPREEKSPVQEKPEEEDVDAQKCQSAGDDSIIKRGHMRWMRQEQVRLKNLQQQEISKQLRRHPGPHRFIPPEDRKLRFPFKSNPKHRNSWSPGTHIIITDQQVIELKVPKEAVEEEEGESPAEEAVQPRDKMAASVVHITPPLPNTSVQRRRDSEQGLNQGLRQNHRNNQQPHERGRSNSFNHRQRPSGSMESLQPPENRRHTQAFYHPNPPAQLALHYQHPPCHYNGVMYTDGVFGGYQQYHHADHANPPFSFQPPPRMRRQMSAPNLKASRETAVWLTEGQNYVVSNAFTFRQTHYRSQQQNWLGLLHLINVLLVDPSVVQNVKKKKDLFSSSWPCYS